MRANQGPHRPRARGSPSSAPTGDLAICYSQLHNETMSPNNSEDWPNIRQPASPRWSDPPAKPEELSWSAGLMFLGCFLTLITLALTLQLIGDSPTDFLGLADDATSQEILTEQHYAKKYNILYFGIIALLWLITGIFTIRGSVVSPVLSAFLAVLNSISFGMRLFDWDAGPRSTLHLIELFIGIGAAVLLNTPNSRRYYS